MPAMVYFCGAAFLFGIAVGLKIRTHKMNSEAKELNILLNEIKKKNNELVTNLSKIYEMSDHDKSKFTEVDSMLFDMWID